MRDVFLPFRDAGTVTGVRRLLVLIVSICATSPLAAQEGKAKPPVPKSIIDAITDTVIRGVYYNTPQQRNLASASAVYSKDLLKSPVTSFRNAVTGRLAGLYTLQTSGLPGADGATFSLRGQAPVIIIDGVQADLTQFDLEEIESITVLKDALGTAMLGARASKGAIVVTTKKGKPSSQQVSFTAQTAVQKQLSRLKPLNAYDYARLHNEALRNDGIDSAYSGAYYTDAALQAYRTHSDPYAYPDVNWQDQVFKNSSLFNRYTLSASGGNANARYFVSLEHINQSGFFKTADSNSYNTNNNFKAYSIRSNVDINITKKLTGGIYLLGRILNGNEPGVGTSTILSNLITTPANAYPVLNRNGSFGGSQMFQNNILAQVLGSGYRQNYKRDVLVNLYLKRSLDDITQGLWMQGKVAFYSTLSETIYRSKSFAVYQANGTGYNQFGTNGSQGNSNGIDYQGRKDYEEFSIGYDRTFKKVHGISGLVMINRDNATSGADLPYTISGGSGRVNYSYDGKYVAEVAFALNGSNRYAGGNTKLGLFPAVGLGWNMEQENFLKPLSWLNRLKLYGSFGKTGWDNAGYYVYYPRYFDGPSAIFGTGAGSVTTITEGTLPNTGITWEKANKLNLGLTGAVLNNRLAFSVEYFNNKYYDLLQQPSKGTTIGNDLPNRNIGINRYTGWEGQLTWQHSKGDFQYFVSANLSTLGSKVLNMDEVPRQYDWMKRTGRPVNQYYGYVAEGLFNSQSEVNASAVTEGYKAQPGDIKYKDLNGDGVINNLDMTTIGNTKPLFMYGVSLGFSYKGFDVSALLQGMENYNVYLSGPSYWAFQNFGVGNAWEHNLNRWTPSNAASAKYPRLSYGANSNNDAVSSYWARSGRYLRLKNAEVGYSLPASLIGKIKLQTVRVFISGYNLLTSASSSMDGRDPESFAGDYPLQRLYNFGINIKF